MSKQRFTPEFKDEAIRQIVDRGHLVAEVSERLGVSNHSLYKRMKAVKSDRKERQAAINEHRHQFWTMTMCRVLRVPRSGSCQWLHQPLSDRAIEDERLWRLIRASYAASSSVYGSPRVSLNSRLSRVSARDGSTFDRCAQAASSDGR